MKKYLFLIATAITLGFTSCEEECDHGIIPEPPARELIGTWYYEELNEEDRYHENGSLYTKYCNPSRSEEIEGRYEYDQKNNKVTWYYTSNGQAQFADWAIKKLTDLSLTISSDKKGAFKYGKIVETYQLEVGETANIQFKNAYPSYAVKSYVSNNERLASVTPVGVIKAEGQKGTTYIKITTDQDNACWVKVVVGDDCLDLWYDYVSMIGMNYAEMKKTLGELGEPLNGEDGYSFVYENWQHDIISIVALKMNPSDGIINDVRMLLKDGVPESKVLSYMKSRYYKFDDYNDKVYYSTLSDKYKSKAIVIYDKTDRVILICETNAFFNPPVADLWTDFVPLFGMDKNYVKTKMEGYQYPFLMSDASYSANGSDYYQVKGNKYVNMVGFVFNPDDVVSEYWVYMKSITDSHDFYNYLSSKYNEEVSEATGQSFVFYNRGKTIRIVLDLKNGAVIYRDMTLNQHESPREGLWGDYTVGLGKTVEELVKKYGEPYYITDDETTFYYKFDETNLDLCSFVFYKGAEKCTHISLIHNEELPASDVVEYLGSLYTVFEKGTSADGSQYAWIDGASLEKSTIGITYFPEDKMVMYQSLK